MLLSVGYWFWLADDVFVCLLVGDCLFVVMLVFAVCGWVAYLPYGFGFDCLVFICCYSWLLALAGLLIVILDVVSDYCLLGFGLLRLVVWMVCLLVCVLVFGD